MRVVQMLSTLSYGDAVGNDALAIYKLLLENGYSTGIYAEGINSKLLKIKGIYSVEKFRDCHPEDVIIYHLSTGTRLNFLLDKYDCKKVIIYHNVTPPVFFTKYNILMYSLTYFGLEGMKYLSDKVDYCLADSEYNKKDLLDAGYQCPIDVRPILIPYQDYEKQPDNKVLQKYMDGWNNIIFVGRVAPNKKHEDIIRIFAYYKKYINKQSRLIMIGSYEGMDNYYHQLKSYVDTLEIQDVVFTGHIKFEEILAYYRVADLFLCMSEHEGFCVPLIESMYFHIPIIAYNSTAIPDTLGGSGVLVDNKDPAFVSRLIDKVLNDHELREKIVSEQTKRLEDFSYESVSQIFLDSLSKIMRL